LLPKNWPTPEQAFDLEFDLRLTSTDEFKVTVSVPELLFNAFTVGPAQRL
jgi:hypothetical protein